MPWYTNGKTGKRFYSPQDYGFGGKSKRRIQYASSDERDDADEIEQDYANRERQRREQERQKKIAEHTQRLQELDREISSLQWSLNNQRLDTSTMQDIEKRLKSFEKDRQECEHMLKLLCGGN